jgi:8-oxo-dGTP diphosphatase
LDLAGDWLEPGWRVLRGAAAGAPHSADAVVLLDDELSHVGEHAEGLIAQVGDVLRPGGLLLASVRNRIHARATGAHLDGLRAFSAAELAHAVQHRGFIVELLTAPGFEREPALVDAAPRTYVVARAPRDAAARSATFFSSLPRKVVAAGVVCHDDAGRVLIVYDSFRRHWTLPGGVVDADEAPAAAAAREAWEEAGVRVTVGRLLDVFPASWPDRLHFIYAAAPRDGGSPDPAPVHAHEVEAAAWVTADEAQARLTRGMLERVRRWLARP